MHVCTHVCTCLHSYVYVHMCVVCYLSICPQCYVSLHVQCVMRTCVYSCIHVYKCVQGGHVCVHSHRHCQYVCVHTLTHARVSICMFVWLACTRVHAGEQCIRYLCALFVHACV